MSYSNVIEVIVIYMAKFDFDQYMNKFANDDLIHKIFFFVYSIGLVIMTLNVNYTSAHDDRRLADAERSSFCPEYQPYMIGFTIGCLITRMSILIMYGMIWQFVQPQGKYVFYSKAPILILSTTTHIYYLHQ